MNEETARRVHSLVVSACAAIDDSVGVVQEGDDEAELAEYRRSAGTVLAAMMEELLAPIYEQHESLIPPQLERVDGKVWR
ncbi:MAG: hypothetical protein ABIT71_07480 [Vicinamibacteraceae bacterium]